MDTISITEVRKAERAHREANGDEATDRIMQKIAGTTSIREVPLDPEVRQTLIDALSPADDSATDELPRGTRTAKAKTVKPPKTLAEVGERAWSRWNRRAAL